MAECVIKMSTCSFRMKSQSCNLAASYERNIPYTCFTNESRTFSTPKTTLRDSARSEPMIRDRSPISGTRGDNVVLTLFHSATKSACIAYSTRPTGYLFITKTMIFVAVCSMVSAQRAKVFAWAQIAIQDGRSGRGCVYIFFKGVASYAIYVNINYDGFVYNVYNNVFIWRH